MRNEKNTLLELEADKYLWWKFYLQIRRECLNAFWGIFTEHSWRKKSKSGERFSWGWLRGIKIIKLLFPLRRFELIWWEFSAFIDFSNGFDLWSGLTMTFGFVWCGFCYALAFLNKFNHFITPFTSLPCLRVYFPKNNSSTLLLIACIKAHLWA